MEDYITRNEHSAVIDRINAEDDRQNHRLDALETNIQQLQELTASVREMSVSIKQMATSIDKQGIRLDELEKQPANRWTRLVDAIIGAVAALLASGAIAAVVHFM